MSVTNLKVNDKTKTPSGMGMTAALRNISILDSLALQVIERPDHLPGIVTFSGPSGFGKSTAAAHVAGRHQALYVEVRSTWTRRALLEAILQSMGIKAGATICKMVDQVSDELATSQRPIILDEFDNAVAQNLVELVRDIYEQSKAPFILIGEEMLPQKLQKWERFHGRIMDWAQAQPANLDDARILNRHYARDIKVEDDLLSVLVEQARGSVRRIVTNLERIATVARGLGIEKINRSDWGDRELHTAIPPQARKKF